MPATIVDPAATAATFREEIARQVRQLPEPVTIAGFLSGEHGPSQTYAEFTRKGCDQVGIRFDLRRVPRLEMEEAVRRANEDPAVHGVFLYYPIFGTEQDHYLRDLVSIDKDVEGLNSFWMRCLTQNRRFLDQARTQKAILPCTPLAIVKLIDAARPATDPLPFAGQRVCIFNRSEVVGRPLANMMAHDGAEVVSFDIDGPLLFVPTADGGHRVQECGLTREQALSRADIVITGVPSRDFAKVSPSEIRPGALCLNFSTISNFEKSIVEKASVFVPRVGPMTVTMALRNTLRLYRQQKLRPSAPDSATLVLPPA